MISARVSVGPISVSRYGTDTLAGSGNMSRQTAYRNFSNICKAVFLLYLSGKQRVVINKRALYSPWKSIWFKYGLIYCNTRTEASHPAREDATAYSMFRGHLAKFDLNEDKILLGSHVYPLWSCGWLHVPCGSTPLHQEWTRSRRKIDCRIRCFTLWNRLTIFN